MQVLPLYDVVTNDQYGNIDYQEEYEESYLQQRTDRVYAHGYQRPQIHDPIIDPLEPGTRNENNHFLQTPQVRFNNQSPPPQRRPPTPVRTPPPPRRVTLVPRHPTPNQPPPNFPIQQQLLPNPLARTPLSLNPPVQVPHLLSQGPEAAGADPMGQLLQSMNNLILAIGTNTPN
ncbi:hypothetical protein F8M41_001900 [Gigaspora margarita]|uniref:Uncharacterized protein n=1 Tax=Gigaspora margarita TaxID=4874 RepID=A0A8H3XDM7_GIGMA|nr:hypothetical protein F8M41_001900 [Gigaspora margarita]